MSRLREKTTATLLIITFMISMFAVAMPAMAKKEETTIQDGVLTYSTGHYLAGEPLQTGFDIFGYNYQGHMFKGSYANSYLGKDGFPPYTGNDESYLTENPDAASKWYWPYREVKLTMKWSDAWLSNKDRDGDGILDRGNEGNEYANSAAEGAWLTNHQRGVNDDGTHWYYFVKIVFPGYDAFLDEDEGVWYTKEGGIEIGTVLWGSYARILQVSNDPAYDEHGVLYNPAGPTGFGCYK